MTSFIMISMSKNLKLGMKIIQLLRMKIYNPFESLSSLLTASAEVEKLRQIQGAPLNCRDKR